MAEKEKKSKQQKPKSKTAKTIQQPKPEEKEEEGSRGPALDKNLCDDCIYEFGECDGQPKFASEFQEGLTGAAADFVVECLAYTPIDKPVVQDETINPNLNVSEGSAELNGEYVGLVLVCAGGCGKTSKDMSTQEFYTGLLEETEEGMVPKWTCPYCVRKTILDRCSAFLSDIGRKHLEAEYDEVMSEARRRYGPGALPTIKEIADTVLLILEDYRELSEEVKERLTVKPEGRPDPNRFRQDEDFGNCQSCTRPLKRTALNQFQDAIRCVNPRCRSYRWIVRLIPSGAK